MDNTVRRKTGGSAIDRLGDASSHLSLPGVGLDSSRARCGGCSRGSSTVVDGNVSVRSERDRPEYASFQACRSADLCWRVSSVGSSGLLETSTLGSRQSRKLADRHSRRPAEVKRIASRQARRRSRSEKFISGHRPWCGYLALSTPGRLALDGDRKIDQCPADLIGRLHLTAADLVDGRLPGTDLGPNGLFGHAGVPKKLDGGGWVHRPSMPIGMSRSSTFDAYRHST